MQPAAFRGSVASAYDEIYLPRIFIPWAKLVAEVRYPLTFEGGIAQTISALAASPVATAVAQLDAETRARLWSAAERRLEPLVVEGQVRTQMVSNLVTARKPG